MTSAEFLQIWALLRECFPASAKLKSQNQRRLWEKITAPYPLESVTDAVLSYTRRSKFFPDPADITGGLELSKEAVSSPPSDHTDTPAYIAETRKYVLRLHARSTSGGEGGARS